MSSFVGLARLAKPHAASLVVSTLLLALHALTTGAYAYLVGPLLKFVYTGGETAGTGMSRTLVWLGWEPGGDAVALTTFIAVLVVALVVVKGAAYFGGTYLVAVAGQRMEHSLRTLLYGHLIGISYDRLGDLPRGDMVSRFVGDVAAVKFAVTHGLTAVVRDALQVVVLAILAVWLDPLLGTITLCVLPVSSFLIVRIGQRIRTRRRGAFDAYGELASATEQTAAALPVLRAFGAEGHAQGRFSLLSSIILRRNLRAWALQVFASPLMELIGAAALAGTLWYAGERISSGALAAEEFVSFFAAVFMLYRPIKSLAESFGQVYSGLAALDRVDGILSIPTEPPDPPDAVGITEIAREIRFDDVVAGYGEAAPVLDGASFAIPAGTTVALVGPSGAGKTTIAMLLLRLVDARSGRVTIDGRDVTGVTRSSLRGLFALVTQEPVLLNDSIAANIAFGVEAAPSAVEAAARAAGAHDFIAALENGYEASVGEAGSRLSGGERQRICIARALLRDRPALILDEATASVDSATESEITASLEKLMSGRTTLLISHRLSTVRRADHVVVLDRGHVVAQGTYEELSRRSEHFRTIFAEQLSGSGSA